MKILRNEFLRSLGIGLLCGGVLGVLVGLLYRRTQDLATVIGISIVMGIVVGVVAGLFARYVKSKRQRDNS